MQNVRAMRVSTFSIQILTALLHAPRQQLGPHHKLPTPKWAICTSATVVYATSALKAVGVQIPDVFVVSEDVEKGKPEYVAAPLRSGERTRMD